MFWEKTVRHFGVYFGVKKSILTLKNQGCSEKVSAQVTKTNEINFVTSSTHKRTISEVLLLWLALPRKMGPKNSQKCIKT